MNYNLSALLGLAALAVASLVHAADPASNGAGHVLHLNTGDHSDWIHLATAMPDSWYGSAEARAIAETVLKYQTANGGWAKNTGYQDESKIKQDEWARIQLTGVGATFDNDSTLTEMRFLAKAFAHGGDERLRAAFLRGLDFIFSAQYANGGWPQYFPYRKNKSAYSSHITFNDGVMVSVMRFLDTIARSDPAYASLDISDETRARARKAFDQGLDCILRTQIVVSGQPTVWCAQHDEFTLKPAGARSYELPSFSGGESAGVVLLLMDIERPSPAAVAAIEGAVAWFEAHKIEGIRVDTFRNPEGERDRVVVPDATAPAQWARFYDLDTGEPYFCDRDGIKRTTLAEIGINRRGGYNWYTTAPGEVLRRHPEWVRKVGVQDSAGADGGGSTALNARVSITLQELEPGICDPVMFEARGTGFTGAGYINTPNDKAARITWSVRSPAGGPHTLEIRFSNGGKEARPGVLEVNGGANGKFDVALPPTGAFAQFQTATLDVGLIAGENTIALQAVTDLGLANIDYLKVTGANPSPGNCGEPEPAVGPDAPVDFSHLNAPPVGWVTQGDGVTGGGGDARPVVVRSMSELQAQAAGAEPRVIHVDGKLRGTLTVGSNKTLIGLQGAEISSDAEVLRLTGSRNVIIKNLHLVGAPMPSQPNTILHDVKNVWLDHNSFINGRTDLLVVSGTSDFVTISWNVFRHTHFQHNHMGVNIGASDNDPTSRGHLRVTHHHNFYAKMVNERMPRVRFGQVHTFNNLCLAGTDVQSRSYYAVRPGVDANIRSERNIYQDFVGPSWWWTSEKLGAETSTVFNYARGNENSVLESIEDVAIPEAVRGPIAIAEHEGVTGQAGFYGNGQAFIPPYAYTAEPTDGLAEKIRAGAGAR